MKAAELYDTDFAKWAVQNARLRRSGRLAAADLEHLAEEIQDMILAVYAGTDPGPEVPAGIERPPRPITGRTANFQRAAKIRQRL